MIRTIEELVRYMLSERDNSIFTGVEADFDIRSRLTPALEVKVHSILKKGNLEETLRMVKPRRGYN